FLLLTVLAWGAAARGQAARSGVLAALSALTKYAGLLNVPLSVIPLYRMSRRKAIVSALLAGGLFLVWCLWNVLASGAALLAAAWRASRAASRRDPFPAACFWSYVAYTGLFVYFGAARYVLPVLPPLVWLLARHGEAERGQARRVASVASGTLLSVL